MSNYSELLKHPKWQKKRLKILERDKFTCQLCGDDETMLHVHHKKYTKGKKPWEYDNKDLITLCKDCHCEISSDYLKDIPFSKIRVFKSNGWKGGNRIMFVSILHEYCSMIIYDENDNFIIGFDLNNDLTDIINILKKAL